MANLNRLKVVLVEKERLESGLQNNLEKRPVQLVNGVVIPSSLTYKR